MEDKELIEKSEAIEKIDETRKNNGADFIKTENIENDKTIVKTKSIKSIENKNPIKEKKKKTRKRRTARSYAIEFLLKTGITIAAAYVVLTFFVGIYVNHRNSSYPMIKDGDLCVTLKAGQIEKGNEVAYLGEEMICFGRVIADAGDVVNIKDGVVTVNDYNVFEEVVYETPSEDSLISYPYTVPENSVFVLNDYRTDYSDSRTYGGISLKKLKGKVIYVMRRRGI